MTIQTNLHCIWKPFQQHLCAVAVATAGLRKVRSRVALRAQKNDNSSRQSGLHELHMFRGGAAVGTRQHTEAITQTQHMSDPNGSKHLDAYTEKPFGRKSNHDPNPSTRVSNMAAAVLRYREIRRAGFNSHLNRHQNVFEEPSDCF